MKLEFNLRGNIVTKGSSANAADSGKLILQGSKTSHWNLDIWKPEQSSDILGESRKNVPFVTSELTIQSSGVICETKAAGPSNRI